jgi:hypothetical protein
MSLVKTGQRYIKYGTGATDGSRGGELGTSRDGSVKAEYILEYDKLPSAEAGNEMQAIIPAHAKLISATLQVLEGAAGSDGSATNDYLSIGLAKFSDAAVIDADGLIKVAALTDIDAKGEIQDGAGALVGTTIGADDAVLTATLDGSSTMTAGKFKVIVEYQPLES